MGYTYKRFLGNSQTQGLWVIKIKSQKEINQQILRILQDLAIQSSCYSQNVMINLQVLTEMIYDSE